MGFVDPRPKSVELSKSMGNSPHRCIATSLTVAPWNKAHKVAMPLKEWALLANQHSLKTGRSLVSAGSLRNGTASRHQSGNETVQGYPSAVLLANRHSSKTEGSLLSKPWQSPQWHYKQTPERLLSTVEGTANSPTPSNAEPSNC
ncbi:UNVERIFIED_CONTAM: hypothetical protein FKN15_056584 [Acipenser sinensis]